MSDQYDVRADLTALQATVRALSERVQQLEQAATVRAMIGTRATKEAFRQHCEDLGLSEHQIRQVIFAVVHGSDLRKVSRDEWARLAAFVQPFADKCAVATALRDPANWYRPEIPKWYTAEDYAYDWPGCAHE